MIILSALKNLNRNFRRTITILFTMALGMGGLFLFHGFNTGVMNQYRANVIRARYGHGQLNTIGYRGKIYEKPWEHWIYDYNEIQNDLKNLPGVEYLFPRITFPALLQAHNINVSGMGQGVNGEAESKFFTTLNVEEGLPLSTEPNGIVLGYGLARSLGVVVGDRVTVLSNTISGSINGVDLSVTGVFHTGSKDFDDVVFRIPLAQAQILLDTQKVETVAIGLNESVPWSTFATAASAKFPNLESTPFEVLDKVYYQHSVDWLGQQFDVIKTVILAIVLLGILNSISTSVLERKQEIGNLRANGESSWDVMKLLLSEGAILGALGGLLGLALAWIVVNTVLRHGIYMPAAPGITRRFYVLIELQPAYAVVTFSLGCCCATLGTLFAGIRVARMNIAEALRSL